MLRKCYTQYVSKFGKLNSGDRTGKSVFIPIPKKGKVKECSNYHTIVLISHASKVMLKILQSRLQQYVNWELSDAQAEFRKGRGTINQIANICWIIQKVREFQKNIYFCFIDYAKVFDCVDHNRLWNILKEMGIPDHLSCLLRNLYANQEQTVRTIHGRTDLFKTGEGVWQGCILSPVCLTSMQSTSFEMLGWMNHQRDQDFQEKYKRLQICRWYHSNGRKYRGSKEPPDEGERGEWQRWLKTQHVKKKLQWWHWVPSLHGK